MECHCQGLNNCVSHWPRARVLGGCSNMNNMCWVRGDPSDYDSWERQGAKGWGAVSVWCVCSFRCRRVCTEPRRVVCRPLFDQIEAMLHVHILRDPNPLTMAFQVACQEAGYAAGNFLKRLFGTSVAHVKQSLKKKKKKRTEREGGERERERERKEKRKKKERKGKEESMKNIRRKRK